MRVIHTADWHLGQRFSGQSREAEHDHFLDWLYEAICTHEIETLVVAGDVFDSAQPPVFAQQQYYRFLARLTGSPCRHIIITGGNHDNPHFLQAADPVLRAINVQVIGAAPEDTAAQIICLPNAEAPRLVVAAIPFLRDTDLRKSRLGQSSDDIETQLKSGIAAHYHTAADHCAGYRERGVPVLATGHLYANGCEPSDTERAIHVGNLGQVSAEAFGEVFDYVALGHLHRPQRVGGKDHIRYSGSPLPLSFTEREYPHQVLMLQFNGACCPEITELHIPVRRRLLHKADCFESLLFFVENFRKTEDELVPWLSLVITNCEQPLEARRKIQEAAHALRKELTIVELRANGKSAPEDAQNEAAWGLSETLMRNPAEVFGKLLTSEGVTEGEARASLEETFGELLDLYYQQPGRPS